MGGSLDRLVYYKNFLRRFKPFFHSRIYHFGRISSQVLKEDLGGPIGGWTFKGQKGELPYLPVKARNWVVE